MPTSADLASVGLTPENLVNLAIALAILIIGWVVARILAAAVSRLLRMLHVDERLRAMAGPDTVRLEPIAGTVVFYIAMLAVLVLFFQRLQLTAITDPLNSLLETVLLYLPRIALAALLLLVAWLVATLVRTLVTRLASTTQIDARLAEQADMDADQPLAVSSSLATAAYYLVFLFFLPGILSVLELGGMAAPLNELLADILGFLPNLLGATLIFLIGYFVARIVRQLVTNLLAAAGADGVVARLGLGEGIRISRILGTAVYALILIPVAISAIETLGIDALSGPAVTMLERIGEAVPLILAAGFILAASWVLARMIGGFVTTLLAGLGFDSVLARLGLRPTVSLADGVEHRPSEIAGTVVQVVVMVFAAMEAAAIVGFEALRDILRDVLAFGGDAMIAIIVLGIGLYFANFLRSVIASSGFGGENNALLARLARVATIVFAVVAALRQLDIAGDLPSNVTLVVLVALGAAFALAFGLGGRDAAAAFIRRRTGA